MLWGSIVRQGSAAVDELSSPPSCAGSSLQAEALTTNPAPASAAAMSRVRLAKIA